MCIKTTLSKYGLFAWMVILYCYSPLLPAQQLSFRHIGNEQGLASLANWNVTIDHYGFIWLATGDGLVRFNGKVSTNFDRSTHPELPVDQIGFLYCDSQNQVWVCTQNGLVCIDKNRQFHRQSIIDSIPDLSVVFCFEHHGGDMFAITNHGAYAKAFGANSWISQPWLDKLIGNNRIKDLRRFDEDRFLLVLPAKGVLLINLKEKKKEYFVSMQGISCAIKYDDHRILIGKSGEFGLWLVAYADTSQKHFIEPPPFFNGNKIHEQINFMVRGADDRIYLTTSGEGMLSIDHDLSSFIQYKHDPVNPLSITSNSLRYIVADSSGSLVITSVEGVNYTNVLNTNIEYVNYLRTMEGYISDDRIISLAEDSLHRLWCCTRDKVFVYNPDTKEASEIYLPQKAGLISNDLAPIWVECDAEGKIWVALRGEGIAVFDRLGKIEKLIKPSDYPGWNIALTRPRIIEEGGDGYMYIGTEDGLFRIAKKNFKLDTFPEDTALFKLRRERIIDILPVDNGIWVSSSPDGAAWHYSFVDKKLKSFNSRNGLPTDRIYGLAAGLQGEIYIGSYNGFSILYPNDSIRTFTKGNGLISPRVEALETDEDGSVWIANNYNLLKYDPGIGEIFRVSGRQGVLNMNFVVMASTRLSSGKTAFGVNKGFVIIDPSVISFGKDSLKVFAFYQDEFGREIECLPGQKIEFPSKKQNIRFTFAIDDMMIADQVTYRYKMSSDNRGIWSVPSINEAIAFNLSPGYYELEVEAYDGHSWFALQGPIQFRIQAPWWKQIWFLVSCGLIMIGLIAFFIQRRFAGIKRKLALSQQINDLESKALKAQMNPHFVFNSLNAIQECIVTGRIDEAYTYLSKFSRLLRLVLEHSDMASITLHEEMEVLSLYVSLEKLRFKDEMAFQFKIDNDLDPEEIRISPMLLQPHLENAIWHGLRTKEGDKILKLSISEIEEQYLEIVIEDNGIGRVKAEAIRQHRLGGSKHNSKGKLLSGNRIDLLKAKYPLTNMRINDMYDDQGIPTGTQVCLKIPILEK